MGITTTKAADLTYDELRSLVRYIEYDSLDYWDHGEGNLQLTAQDMLDIYHAAGDWDGIEAWLQEDPSAGAVYERIVAKRRRVILRKGRAKCASAVKKKTA